MYHTMAGLASVVDKEVSGHSNRDEFKLSKLLDGDKHFLCEFKYTDIHLYGVSNSSP